VIDCLRFVHPAGFEFHADGRADKQTNTDMTILTVAFRNFANAAMKTVRSVFSGFFLYRYIAGMYGGSCNVMLIFTCV